MNAAPTVASWLCKFVGTSVQAAHVECANAAGNMYTVLLSRLHHQIAACIAALQSMLFGVNSTVEVIHL
jgi:hypothetical protein